MSEKPPTQTKKPTSLYVNPELWKDAKIEAIRRGVTVTDLFETALRHELGKSDHSPTSRTKTGPQRLHKP